MSESVKPRFAVDLNEIERQLAQAGTSQSQPASAGRSDPLAELARIVGQDDPFQAILANDGANRPRQQGSSIDDLFAVRDTMPQPAREAPVRAPQAAHSPQSFELGGYPQSHARHPEPAYAPQPAPQEQDVYGNEAYAQDYYADQAGPYAEQDYDQPQAYAPVEKGRSRKSVVAIAAVVGAVVLGGGGAYLASGSSAVTGGEPPLVKASTEPTKVQPQNPGGVEIPNQNKQIYERSNQNGATKVVNREEQPVDVEQAIRMNGGAVDNATGGVVKPQQTASLNLGEPKKVRTVTIRPDGTVVGAEPAPAQPAAAAAPMTLPPQAQPAPAPVQVASAEPRAAVSAPVAAPATPASKPAPAAAAPAPQQVASAQPEAPAAAEATPTGGYAVQLGLANSEAGAQTAFASFQRKYPDLEGLPSIIRKAEVNGNTIYRVRVGPLSKEEASSLCSKLQGQGGQCFVAKN